MANLIIKPTSGGSLILQDEGGTAANTIDASGNTQLAGTLGVTGNATLSGTANVYGQGAFPAGHVIFTTPTAAAFTSTNLAAAWTSTVVTASITPLYSNSSILLFANFFIYVNDNAGDVGVSTRVKKVHSGGTSYPADMNTHDGSGGMHSTFYNNIDPGDGGHMHALVTQDSSAGVAGSSVTYTLEGWAYNSSATSTIGGNLNNRWWIYLQEVKR